MYGALFIFKDGEESVIHFVEECQTSNNLQSTIINQTKGKRGRMGSYNKSVAHVQLSAASFLDSMVW